MTDLTPRTQHRLERLHQEISDELTRVRKEKTEAMEQLERAQRALSRAQDEEQILETTMAELVQLGDLRQGRVVNA